MEVEKTNDDFLKECCPTCKRTFNYQQTLAKGHAKIMVALYNATKRLGRNQITKKEMVSDPELFGGFDAMIKSGFVNDTMAGNLSCLVRHGLLAKVKNEKGSRKSGCYLITRKGGLFLRGEPVFASVFVKKKSKDGFGNHGYDESKGMVTIAGLLNDNGPFWNQDDYNVENFIN